MLSGLGTKELKDGMTAAELAIRTGKSVKWVREKLALIAAADRLIVGRKRQMGLDGRIVLVPVYKIAPTNKAKSRG